MKKNDWEEMREIKMVVGQGGVLRYREKRVTFGAEYAALLNK